MFTAIQEGNFQLVTNFRNSEIPIYSGLIIPQAWTLGVELSFYLIAPFVLKRFKFNNYTSDNFYTDESISILYWFRVAGPLELQIFPN